MEFIFPETRMEEALKVLNRLVKVGQKMGRDVTFNTEDTNPLVFKKYLKHVGEIEVSTPRKKVTLNVDGADSILEYDNARFVARIDITDSGNAMVFTAPDYDKTIPEHYFAGVEPKCDHCGHNRRRVRYYLVEKDDTIMQVGSSCVKEFIGINPSWVLNTFENLYKMKHICYETHHHDYSPSYSVLDVARLSYAIVKCDGGYSRGHTSSTVDMLIDPPVNTKLTKHAYEEYLRLLEKYDTDEFKQAIKDFSFSDFVKFVTSMNDSNYAMNLKSIITNDWVPNVRGAFATLVSGAYIFVKSQGLERKESTKKKLNEWVDAQVKDRISLNNVKVEGKHICNGFYGESYLYRMLDSDGRTLIWFASNEVKALDNIIDKDEVVNITGTIKKFDTREFKGIDYKQTVLNRVKVR